MVEYKYLSIIVTKDISGEIIQNKHIVYGKYKTQKCNVRPMMVGVHEVIEVIELPYPMNKHHVNIWCDENKLMLNKKLYLTK